MNPLVELVVAADPHGSTSCTADVSDLQADSDLQVVVVLEGTKG